MKFLLKKPARPSYRHRTYRRVVFTEGVHDLIDSGARWLVDGIARGLCNERIMQQVLDGRLGENHVYDYQNDAQGRGHFRGIALGEDEPFVRDTIDDPTSVSYSMTVLAKYDGLEWTLYLHEEFVPSDEREQFLTEALTS